MDKSNQLTNLLPEVPDNFCFKQNEFSTTEFEVDLFIRKHKNNMPLEQLREDLSIYLRNLRLSLVDLINSDYEEFIHLTSNYIDLNNNINNLTYSLSKIKKDVERSHEEIEMTIDKLNENLDYIRLTLKQKKDLNFILKASKMIDCIENDLEQIKLNDNRLVASDRVIKFDHNFSKISYQLNAINQKLNKLSLNSSYVNQTFKMRIDNLNEEVSCYLDDKLDEFIEQQKETKQNSDGLINLLEIAILNEQSNQFIELLFNKVFKHELQEFICDLNIDRLGIANFYRQLFEICEHGFKLFKNANTIGINLNDRLIDCVSFSVYEYLTINASTLFLAGNPETFILNFKETISFFKRLLALNSSDKQPEEFKIFKEIRQKFNCEIYFHIRLSEISNELSKALDKPIECNHFNEQPNQIKIQLIDELLKLINHIWSDQIYINTLFYEIWRLTLLLISRYTLFLKQFQFDSNLLAANSNSSHTNDQLQSTILIRLINESSLLINSIQQIYATTIKSKIPAQCNEYELASCLNQSFNTLCLIGLPSINANLKQVLCAQCATILNQIKEIPRLYRKTNREKPTKPSAYIVNCVELFQQLKQIQKCSSSLILDILNEVTNDFYSLANEVLKSLQKMEESLMRLKKVQQTANGNLKNLDKKTTMSDADKIRLQFKLDVDFYNNVSN